MVYELTEEQRETIYLALRYYRQNGEYYLDFEEKIGLGELISMMSKKSKNE